MSSSPPRSPPTIVFGSHTDIGRRRGNNEDCHRCERLGRGALLVVCDGVGGTRAGEVASQMAVDGLHALAAEHAARGGLSADHRATLDAAARTLDRRIREAAREPGSNGMGATLSALWLEGEHAAWVQVGDSRIYRLRDRELRQISPDQSPVGRMRADGQLTEEEARAHPYRHMIDQCLGGGGPAAEPQSGELTVAPGDIFLLCSDGLSDGLWDRDIARELAAAQTGGAPAVVARTLVDRANAASGNDNITAVVARLEETGELSPVAELKRVAASLLQTLSPPRDGPAR